MDNNETEIKQGLGSESLKQPVGGSFQANDPGMGSSNRPNDPQPVSMKPVPIGSSTSNVPTTINPKKLQLKSLSDIPITLAFEVGRTMISVQQLMGLGKGSVLPLQSVSVDSIDVRVGEQIIARAETFTSQRQYGIRFGEVEIPPELDLD